MSWVLNGVSSIQSSSSRTYSPALFNALFLLSLDTKSEDILLVAAPSGVAWYSLSFTDFRLRNSSLCGPLLFAHAWVQYGPRLLCLIPHLIQSFRFFSVVGLAFDNRTLSFVIRSLLLSMCNRLAILLGKCIRNVLVVLYPNHWVLISLISLSSYGGHIQANTYCHGTLGSHT